MNRPVNTSIDKMIKMLATSPGGVLPQHSNLLSGISNVKSSPIIDNTRDNESTTGVTMPAGHQYGSMS